MYFTGAELRPFEREMRQVPYFDKTEIWDDVHRCEDCRNYNLEIKKCMKVHCPYLKRKFLTDSVTTHKLFKTFLRQIEYQPFKRRFVEVMSEFSGNRQFVDRGHCERFSEAIKVISSYDYNSLAALYVLTMSPSLWYDVTLSVNRYVAISPFTNKKEDVLIEFANALYSRDKFVDLRGITNCRRISNSEFIYLCNAMLIKRFGLSALKLGD